MEAPKCRLCGERHYGLCQKYAGPIKKLQKLSATEREIVRDMLVEMGPQGEPYIQKAVDVLDEAAKTSKPKFDRTAYQRDYMRKRRVKKP